MEKVVENTLRPLWVFSEDELIIFCKEFVRLYTQYFIRGIPECKDVCKDIVLDSILEHMYGQNTSDLMRTIHFVKVAQMRTGKFMQEVLGCFPGWQSLGEGHETGLDLYNKTTNTFVELKNRYNTDNASARAKNIDKLWLQKQNGYNAIYGVVNDKQPKGVKKQMKAKDNTLIDYLSGDILFEEVTKIKNFSKVLSDIITELSKQ